MSFLLSISLFVMVGCASDQKPAQLTSRGELKVNAGQALRVIGVARFSKVTGPSVAGEDFELRVYPRTIWGVELEGKKVEVTGLLNDSSHATPPDPTVLPGEYWLSNAKWIPAEVEKK